MSLDAYPRIGDWIGVRNGRLRVRTGKVDIGQRISTALIQIAHEELTIPPDRIEIAPVKTGHAPDEGVTSGSNSIEQSGFALRAAAATLRGAVIAAVSAKFGGDPDDWNLESGELQLPGSNHRFALLDLIEDMPSGTAVDPAAPPLRKVRQHLPRPTMRGIGDMVCGKFQYIQDIERPGMLHARVARPPHVHARLRGIDARVLERLKDRGFEVIHDGSFLALAGNEEWPTIKGVQTLARACEWDTGPGLSEKDVFTQLSANRARRFLVVDGTPTAAAIPDPNPQPTHSARYERTYQLHGSLAPSAAMAEWRGGFLSIHSQSQGIYPLRESIADSLGLREDQVEITHVPGSGCYGHTGADDAAFEAALIARALPGRPVLLKWTREDEHAWEPFASAMALDLTATLTGGKIAAYEAEVFSDTHRGRPRPGSGRAGPAKLLANRLRFDPVDSKPAEPNLGRHAGMHRNLDPVYDFDDKRLVKNLVDGLPHRTSAMRCLGAAANVFALESFMDEMARIEGTDPLDFRRAHLSDPRALAVLAELERQVQRRPPLAENQGRGIAFAQYKNAMTRVAVQVELAVNDRAEVSLLHATIVADAGRVVDADGLVAQLEGGVIQAASWSLCERIDWDRDGITTRDWDSYPVIRFDNIPCIETVLIDRPDQKSLGAGEASPPPMIAAIANAVFDATGLRMRRLPFTPRSIQESALSQ